MRAVKGTGDFKHIADQLATLLEGESAIHFQPLSDRQIRVLALQHGQGDDPLACQLHVLDVTNSDVSFEAISYVWGSQDTPESIACRVDAGGEPVRLPITRNAADALKAFRKPQDERLLWIDSICISQTSQLEKSTQVGMMDSIFTSARAVLIWLGREDVVRSPAAGALFQRWADWSQIASPSARQKKLSRPRTNDGFCDLLEREFFSPEEVGIILDVFECEWFRRLWCVQELALAEKAFVCWGSVKLTWETISDVAIHVQALHPTMVARSGLAGVQNVHMLEHLRGQIKGEARRQLTFSRLLSLTRSHGVSEDRDRTFSLLGLDRKMRSSKVAGMEPEELFVTPDYSQSLDEIYLSMAKQLLIREGNLHLLSFVQHEGKITTGLLPSWVPKWHVNMHRLITQFDLVSGHPVNVALGSAWRNRNSSNSESLEEHHVSGQPFHIFGDSTLQAEGLLLGTVLKKCDDLSLTPDPRRSWIKSLRQWFRTVVSWLEDNFQPPSVTSNQLNDIAFRVFYRTLFGGHLNIKQVFATLREELPAFRALLYSVGAEDDHFCPTTQSLVLEMCRSRTLFLTVQGKVGIGPQILEPGDSICLLSGAAVPLLMRPCSQEPLRWLLVGETYVNGLAYVSDDYEIAEDFEALHIESISREMLTFIHDSKSRVRNDLNQEIDRRMHVPRVSFSNYFVRLEFMSGKPTCGIVTFIVILTCCPTEDEILQDFVESSASVAQTDGRVVRGPDFGELRVFLIR